MPHVHVWDLTERPQPWTAEFPALQRSFLLPEPGSVLAAHGVDAVVVVQAGDTVGETLDLLALAATTPAVAGVVGWVDLESRDVPCAVATLPDVRFVLHHAGKPPIAGGGLHAWRADLARLADLPNVAVKLSGLVTEADWAGWTQADSQPVIDHVLACFGAQRTMAGSDWPVCLLAAGYGTVRSTLTPALARLDDGGRAAVLGGTAARWYRTRVR